MSGTAKILILGNGFDLAHFLPTKYDHFMHAMRNVEEYSQDTPMTFQELYTDLMNNEKHFFENSNHGNVFTPADWYSVENDAWDINNWKLEAGNSTSPTN